MRSRRSSRFCCDSSARSAYPIERLRPAVYPPDAGAAWDELLRFRHFLRLARAAALTEPHIHTIADTLSAD